MHLCIDQGNSASKIALFSESELIKSFSFKTFNTENARKIFESYPIKHTIISSVANRDETLIRFLKEQSEKFIELTHETPIPIKNKYATPETLGKDRLAAVVGAFAIAPQKDLLIIDIGTAITYDFLDQNAVYWGGNISPGVDLRLHSLHMLTKNLPLVKLKEDEKLLGDNTESAISAGVLHGITFEINGYIDSLKKNHPSLSTFLTGGGAFLFANRLKNRIFAYDFLVLIGLNHILRYNA